jgi:prephenate dehydrogenase
MLKEPFMKNVLIVGVGLIGGSIALAIKKEHDVNIIGFDIEEHNTKAALNTEVIHEVSTDLEQAAKKSDLIIIATPVEETLKVMDELARITPVITALVMDAGSTKKTIMEKAELLKNKGIVFIGGHPMAGSHKTGVESAKLHLFENAYFILTPCKETCEKHVESAKDWLKGTNAKFLVISPDEHDLMTGIVSHFPHLIAASLVRLTKGYSEDYPLVQQLAAGGFRDITRIASSSPKMWSDIVTQNKPFLLSILQEWKDEMSRMGDLIESAGSNELIDYFSSVKAYRDELPLRSKGAIQPFADLYVDILDKVGAISEATSLLAESNISITNLSILEVREGLDGVLRISLQNEDDRDHAQEVLHRKNYKTSIMP